MKRIKCKNEIREPTPGIPHLFGYQVLHLRTNYKSKIEIQCCPFWRIDSRKIISNKWRVGELASEKLSTSFQLLNPRFIPWQEYIQGLIYEPTTLETLRKELHFVQINPFKLPKKKKKKKRRSNDHFTRTILPHIIFIASTVAHS